METQGTNLPAMAGGAAVSVTGAVVSNLDRVEQLMRMGASAVAIISGLVVIYLALRKQNKDKS